ncbi:MAG: hypothetical protein FJ098_00665, partial [Deltaproteobacteria bacterium]|nr:hypothetical protein [Deltaproteobacteria bacterium]
MRSFVGWVLGFGLLAGCASGVGPPLGGGDLADVGVEDRTGTVDAAAPDVSDAMEAGAPDRRA